MKRRKKEGREEKGGRGERVNGGTERWEGGYWVMRRDRRKDGMRTGKMEEKRGGRKEAMRRYE